MNVQNKGPLPIDLGILSSTEVLVYTFFLGRLYILEPCIHFGLVTVILQFQIQEILVLAKHAFSIYL